MLKWYDKNYNWIILALQRRIIGGTISKGMFSRILSFRQVITKVKVSTFSRISVEVQKTMGVRGRLNSTQTSNVLQQTEPKVNGFWDLIERHHTKRHIRISTPLLRPTFLELDVKSGPDIKILSDNIKANMKDNQAITEILSLGSALSFLYCCYNQYPDIHVALTTFVAYNWPIWLIIYYHEQRIKQNTRLLNSVNKIV